MNNLVASLSDKILYISIRRFIIHCIRVLLIKASIILLN